MSVRRSRHFEELGIPADDSLVGLVLASPTVERAFLCDEKTARMVLRWARKEGAGGVRGAERRTGVTARGDTGMTHQRKRKLSQRDLQQLGARPALVVTRYERSGERAVIQQLVAVKRNGNELAAILRNGGRTDKSRSSYS